MNNLKETTDIIITRMTPEHRARVLEALPKIEDMTGQNEHTDAILMGIPLLEMEDKKREARMVDELLAIRTEVDRKYLTPELMKQRTDIYRTMMDFAELRFDTDVFREFHNCY
jgi:hypothetical protein